MKFWASASALGLSVAYLAIGCSSEPPPSNDYKPPTGTAGNGGSTSTAGTNAQTGGTPPATGGTNGAGGSGTAGSAPTTAGTTGSGGSGTAGTGGSGTAGTGGSGMAGTGGTGAPGAETMTDCPVGVLGHCSAGETYPTYAGYKLALVEDFPAAIDLDTDKIWTWSDGSPADGQTNFRKEQIGFVDGNMTITATAPDGCMAKTTNAACIPPRNGAAGSYAEALNPNKQSNVGAMGVWSGEFRTKYNNYRYGRYEAKFRAPIANPGMHMSKTTSGDFLSTLFVFRNPKNQVWNEIDVELEPNHFDELAGNVINVPNRTAYPGDVAGAFVTQQGLPTGYTIYEDHVYAFTWEANKVEWFVDGMSVHVEMSNKVPQLSAKIMANLWVFSGNAFGEGVNNKFPFTATYDWIRFYKSDAETKYPCDPLPACLDAADKTQSAQNNPTEMNYGL